MSKLETPITILVRRRAALGDVIIATGVIRELKNKYGDDCVIDVVTEHPYVFDNNPHIRQVYHTEPSPPDPRTYKVSYTPPNPADYNVYYNLDDTYEFNPEGHFADNYFYRVFGSTDCDKSLELFVDDDTASAVDELIASIGGPFICVHMRNWHWALKNIKPDVWDRVLGKVLAEDLQVRVVAVGGPTDYICMEDHPRMIDARGLSPSALCYLMDHAKCFVGMDSAI